MIEIRAISRTYVQTPDNHNQLTKAFVERAMGPEMEAHHGRAELRLLIIAYSKMDHIFLCSLINEITLIPANLRSVNAVFNNIKTDRKVAGKKYLVSLVIEGTARDM